MLESQTRGGMMEGADESTELWRHPSHLFIYQIAKSTAYYAA